MKRVLIILLIIFIAGIFLLWHGQRFSYKPPQDNTFISPSPQPTSKEASNIVSYIFNNKSFSASFFEVTDLSKLSLYPNFNQKLTASDFLVKQKCEKLVSGGFYTKDNSPTGLFISEGKTLTDFIPNNLFNGIISIDTNDVVRFTNEPTSETVKWALQTGPWLIRDSQPVFLKIQNDEGARRMVAGLTTNNTLLYIAFYDPDNLYEGPLLSDLPNHLIQFQKNTGVIIKDAINLDGGSASAFYSDGLFLQELTPVGGFFCITRM